ncbi:MAG: XrtN system VIT domain-containing protein [Daejeonella sp.]
MKPVKTTIFSDPIIAIGLGLITLSTLIFYISDERFIGVNRGSDGTELGAFFLNYIITVIFSFVVIINSFIKHRWSFSKSKIEYTILLLVLWFISAFSLNREMNIFDTAVGWLCVLINLSCVVLILTIFRDKLPGFIKYLVSFFLGLSFLLFLYYAIYLTPLYPVSCIGFFVFGISLHSYIPLALAIITGIMAYRIIKKNPALKIAFFSGLLIPLIFCIWFMVQWGSVNRDINFALNHNTLSEGKLPAWTAISQNIPKNFISERVIKTDLVYKSADMRNGFFGGGFNSSSFNEIKKHDPLVVIATLFFGKPNLDTNDRIKILESMYDSRHQAQERLWSGDELQTASVVSNVKLFPEFRLAYTEKILTIQNKQEHSWRGSQQEAIYTFHLPEGSVVTSLSLWIKGKEEKAHLTTKAKADSAYNEIVGVEVKDPSVIHWQEGNTVSVRVFPCTAEENRKFKIGVSSPLHKEGEQLIYENIYFDGPSGMRATESVQLAFSQKPMELKLPTGYIEVSDGVYQADRGYQPYWEISCKAPNLSGQTFSFSDSTYRVKEYTAQYEHFEPETIFLDLNNSWSEIELMEVWESIKLKKVYVFDGKLTTLSDGNIHKVYKQTAKQNFSLFPLYKISHPEKALIISKSADTSPNLNDLKGSEFQENLTAYLKIPKNIRLYTIGHQLSPYLKALKEFRVFNYNNGSIVDLKKQLKNKQFIVSQENADHIVIDHAGLMIEQIPGTIQGKAPDHLLRLFAYNDLMKKVGANYFNNDYVQPDIIKQAEKAYVVSPVSSLIVLETQNDYERFDIEENKNSLKNASMKSSGSVPEPHEWMLIILTAAVIIYLVYKPRFTRPVF